MIYNNIDYCLKNYRQVIVNSNTSSLEEARVVFLLVTHTWASEEAKYLQFAFNQAVIENFYNHLDTDVVLVEESSDKKKFQLLRNQVPDLKFQNYKFKGWDHPEICKQSNELKKDLNFISRNLAVIEKENLISVEKTKREVIYQKMTLLKKEDTQEDKAWEDLKNCLVSGDETHFEKNKKLIVTTCRVSLLQIKISFIEKTFAQRQEHLIRRIEHYLGKNKKKIFVLAGYLHADKRNATTVFAPHVDQLIQKIQKVSFMILNPDYFLSDPVPSKITTVFKKIEETTSIVSNLFKKNVLFFKQNIMNSP